MTEFNQEDGTNKMNSKHRTNHNPLWKSAKLRLGIIAFCVVLVLLSGIVFITVTWITITSMPDEVSRQQSVGFYAISTRQQDLAIDQIVTFDHVYTNVGSGYNSTSGQFIVPISGMYRIGNTGMSLYQHPVFLKMMKNGAEVGRSTGVSAYMTADMEAVLKLKKGDIIDIRRRTNSRRTTETLHGNRLASFTGFLIAKTQT